MRTRVEFPIAELRLLSKPSGLRGAVDLAVDWGGIALALACVALCRRWYVDVAAFLFISTRQNSIANLAHDAWHWLCFPSQKVNDVVGAWFYAYPLGIPFLHDRARHLRHHKRVGYADDPDWVNYSNAGRATRLRLTLFFTGRAFGSLLFEVAWSVLVRRRPRIAVEPEGAPTRSELPLVAFCQLVLFGTMTWGIGVWAYPVLWILPLVTVTAWCNSVRAFVEHSAVEDTAAPESRLFDVEAGLFECMLFAPRHFNYHALHHAFPSVPHYRLPAARTAVTVVNGEYPFATLPGYARALGAHIERLGAPGAA